MTVAGVTEEDRTNRCGPLSVQRLLERERLLQQLDLLGGVALGRTRSG